MYLLEYKPEKVHASDDKSLKMNHATFALDSATTTPSSGKKTRWSDLAQLYFAMQKVSHNTQKNTNFISINVHHILINIPFLITIIVLTFLIKIIVLSSSCHSCWPLVRFHIGPLALALALFDRN